MEKWFTEKNDNPAVSEFHTLGVIPNNKISWTKPRPGNGADGMRLFTPEWTGPNNGQRLGDGIKPSWNNMPRRGGAPSAPHWTPTGRKVTLGDGSRRSLFKNHKFPGQLRVRKMHKGRDGKLSATYILPPHVRKG